MEQRKWSHVSFSKSKILYFIKLQDTGGFYLIVVVQSDGLEVLQFPQIPQFQRAILGTWRITLENLTVFKMIKCTLPNPFSARTMAEDAVKTLLS